jgi:hypothetical protein
MNVVSCWRRAERRVRCVCDAAVAAHRLARGISVAECPHCGQWFVARRLPAPRRIADLLVQSLTSYAHPDDVVMVPWTPF